MFRKWRAMAAWLDHIVAAIAKLAEMIGLATGLCWIGCRAANHRWSNPLIARHCV
jgi:hypothetical protein